MTVPVTHHRIYLSSILVPKQRRAAEPEEWREREREREIFWIEWTRTGGQYEDKDGWAGGDIFGQASHGLRNIFGSSGWYKQPIPKINFRYQLSLTADTKK
jgi:hypothetical protein